MSCTCNFPTGLFSDCPKEINIFESAKAYGAIEMRKIKKVVWRFRRDDLPIIVEEVAEAGPHGYFDTRTGRHVLHRYVHHSTARKLGLAKLKVTLYFPTIRGQFQHEFGLRKSFFFF